MAEIDSYTFSFQEIAEALIKREGITEGLWQVMVEFGIGAANVELPNSKGASPAAIVPIQKFGIFRVSHETPMSVDAAKVNPKK